ncbi:MTP-1 family protein [Geobacillus sp. YF-1]|uniref:MTP-1 family protein n=1 Tax=Geobacillus sp. YF-1 TaxID=3457480 RepID=UPI00404684DC
MLFQSPTLKTCQVLVDEFRLAPQPFEPQKLRFAGVGDRDVYNISAPFADDGELVIAGRVESRDSEQSEVYFFVERDGVWIPREGAPVFALQDPFVARIHGQLVFGGVETFLHPVFRGEYCWRTVFYRGPNIRGLKPFAQGPDGMKDIRLVELKDGSIGVFTRPQGEKGGRGKIGFTRIVSLDDLTPDVIEAAPLLDAQFTDEEWGGVNEAHLLANGLVGALGHIACFDEHGNRHYYPMVFVLNPETMERSELELLALRSHFLDGPAKRPDLTNVVFSGGLIRKGDGTAELYAGVGDAEAQKISLIDPFVKYEAQELDRMYASV